MTEQRTPEPSTEGAPAERDRGDDVRRSARVAGLRDFEMPTLEQVERRRFELLGLIFFILVGFAMLVALLSGEFFEPPGWLVELGRTGTVLRGMLVGLAILFSVYVWEKERHLAKLARALVNERVLSAALANRLKEISLLTEAGKAVVSHLELEEVLGVILDAASDLLGADEGSVMLLDGDSLLVSAATGHGADYIGVRVPVAEGLAGHVARNRESLLIEGRVDTELVDTPLRPREEDILSAVSIPLEAKGELLGVLNLNVREGDRRFDEYDLRALALFGEHAAMAVRHGRTLRKEREMRQQIAKLDHLRSELVGTVTHDLKTPLTTILGSAKMLKTHFDALSPEQRREIIDTVERQSERLLQLIDRLLGAAKAHARHPVAVGPLDLVAHIEPLVRAYASAHDRNVVVHKESDRVPAIADPDAIEQVVANLLENAVKHTPAGTNIRVRIASRGSVAEVSVADDGPGIASEELPHLFEPFRQGTLTGEGGVGLGLFIVRSLVVAMGGHVDVQSPPGDGACFTFTLPGGGSEHAGSHESLEAPT